MKYKKLLYLIPLFVMLAITIIGGSILKNHKYFEELAVYGKPVCIMDKHEFTGETCEECGSNITNAGVFYSLGATEMYPTVDEFSKKFSDYYSSYEEFDKDFNSCVVWSAVIVNAILIVILFYIVCLFYKIWRKKYVKLDK